MDRVQKESDVTTLKEKLAKAQSLVLADFRGVKVSADSKLRSEFRANGCEYKVVKNTLLGLAVKGTPMEVIGSYLEGPTAIAFSFEDAAAPAKVAVKFAKDEEKFVIKGGFLDGQALDQQRVEALSKMPDKNQMRAMFLSTLLAVPQKFLRLTQAAPQNFLYLLAARERSMGEGENK